MRDNRTRSLERACSDALLDSLPQSLKDALDAALAKGAARKELLAHIHRLTGGPRAPHGGLTYLAAQAYLENKRP